MKSSATGSALLKTIAVTVLVALALSLVAGSIYQEYAQRTDRASYPPPGSLFTIDDLSLHLDCRGEGTPAVIIESGLMSGSSNWALVHDELSSLTRVCTYDRPGMDWSEPTDEPLTAATVADHLHQLLVAAGIEGDKILVGMSAGGVFVREYYHRYGDDIVGMVLVDSSHEQQGLRLPEITTALDMSTLLNLCSWLQPVGVVRALDLLQEPVLNVHLPQAQLAVVRANAYQSHTCAAMLRESEGFEQEVTDPQPPASLGDLPLTVLSQGRIPEDDELEGFSREQVTRMRETWDQLQQELADLSTNSRRVIARRSGHLIHIEQPALVIAEISNMVKSLR